MLKLLGSNIRSWREARNLTQEEFAAKVGFSRSYITEIETGKRNISILNFLKIITSLDVDPKFINDLFVELKKYMDEHNATSTSDQNHL